jgi:single-stranded-DNA-specific exonuclease
MIQPQWQIIQSPDVPQWFWEAVKRYTLESDGHYAAQLLWQRGIQDPLKLPGFLDPDAYKPTSPFAFGQEMKWAVKRLQKARELGEKVTIWGDFDADGITATSVLWDGLGEFFTQYLQLNYYIPNRFTESHGLNCPGIEKLAQAGTKLIVTCDTGSNNLTEIEFAKQLGIDIIITDHHTLPDERPDVIGMINSRYFAETHPLYHLSGVAVAYKLIEALYLTLPDIPTHPLENLLDLVAIGLIADLVQLSGDCRYLAQRGIQQLQIQSRNPTRPGVSHLLQFCQTTGDRPTDISFGLGPRINAVSRIHGEANFCVELLTNQDSKYCHKLALETELANTRRKAIQKDLAEQVRKKLAQIDLSTTSVIVLDDPQWPSGILGLVAGQIAQEYGRPTILLTTANEGSRGDEKILARGSARSVQNIDLYQLVASQSHLLHRFGGHPLAAGLSMFMENLPLFRDGINQQLRQQITNFNCSNPLIEIDLIVTVAELGKSFFRELKILEPYGMGNPVPRLLIHNCWFQDVRNRNAEDLRGKKVRYLKTTFQIWDDTVTKGFPGMWWEHSQEELPQQELCDAIVELDFNAHEKRYEVRLIAVRPTQPLSQFTSNARHHHYLIDWRCYLNLKEIPTPCRILQQCPQNWDEIQREYHQALADSEKLALAYPPPPNLSPQELWHQLVGIAKYLRRTGKTVAKTQLREKLGMSDRSLNLGLEALSHLGFKLERQSESVGVSWSGEMSRDFDKTLTEFLEGLAEEQFQRQYFYQIPLPTLEGILLS